MITEPHLLRFGFWHSNIKTSFGLTFKVLSPLFGHKLLSAQTPLMLRWQIHDIGVPTGLPDLLVCLVHPFWLRYQ